MSDELGGLAAEGVSSRVLTQFFDWLKGTGWTVVSLDDIAAAATGARRLPDKAILLSFDDGYRSIYTRVFPLLKAYRYPAVAALVGSWMEERPDGTVLYGDSVVPRSDFISWDEAREMQASGLVEFASHSYDLHRGIEADPQGSIVPAAIARRYDQGARRVRGRGGISSAHSQRSGARARSMAARSGVHHARWCGPSAATTVLGSMSPRRWASRSR